MSTYLVFVAIGGAFAVGVALGVLVMSLLAMASLGEEALEQQPPFKPQQRYQD